MHSSVNNTSVCQRLRNDTDKVTLVYKSACQRPCTGTCRPENTHKYVPTPMQWHIQSLHQDPSQMLYGRYCEPTEILLFPRSDTVNLVRHYFSDTVNLVQMLTTVTYKANLLQHTRLELYESSPIQSQSRGQPPEAFKETPDTQAPWWRLCPCHTPLG